MTQHRGRYPFRIYLLLVFVIGIFAAVNNVFNIILQAMNGQAYLTVITLAFELIGHAVVFALLFWIADTKGNLGSVMRAKDAESVLGAKEAKKSGESHPT